MLTPEAPSAPDAVTNAASAAAFARAARPLLAGVVDYAGLFPPAGLAMAPTVHRYAAYRRGPQRALLGRLVVPIARLEEFEAAALDLLPTTPRSRPATPLAPERPGRRGRRADLARGRAFNAGTAPTPGAGARW
jgi:hypothetical protein